MRIYYILVLLLSIILMGCTSAQRIEKNFTKANFPEWKTDLKVLSMSADINTTYHGESNSGKIKLTLAGTDSLTLTLYGPFGITIGKLYARPDYFVFYNLFNNEAIEGEPTANNLKQAAMIPLSFRDLVRLVRCETLGAPENFELVSMDTLKNVSFYRNNLNSIEFASVDMKSNNLIKYAVQNATETSGRNRTILSVDYSGYNDFEGFALANKMSFLFPEIDSQINLDVTDIQINKNINYQFSFKIPDSIKRIKLD